MALLEVHNVSKSFIKDGVSVRVLDDVSLSLEKGTCLGLVGQSGCGKSTLARIITRLTDADSGRIILGGFDITQLAGMTLRPVYNIMQMVFQLPEDSFNPRRRLGWSIAEPLRRYGVSAEECKTRVADLLERVELSALYAERYPHEVSGGECQRAAIARALALNPGLLICDEITSALDVTIQRDIVSLIRSLVDKGMACLFVTHDLALLPQVADHVAVMEHGRIAERADVTNIVQNPQSSAARELMEADLFAQEF